MDENKIEDIGLGIADIRYGTYTEAGIAERLIQVYGDSVKWCEDTDEWYLYDDATGLWIRKDVSAVIDKIVELADEIESCAMNATSDNGAKEIIKYANKLRELKHARAAITFAKNRLSCKYADFDANAELLGLPNNKVLNVITGEVLDGDAKYMMTRSLNGTPLAETSKEFNHYIDVFMPEADVRNYFQMYCGSALIGVRLRNPSDKKALFVDNKGNTGKTTFLHALRNSMGSYYTDTKVGLITEKDAEGNKPDTLLADLPGRRIAGISECPDDSVLCAWRFKSMTGNDMQIARLPHAKDLIKFIADYRLLVMTNVLPTPDKADDVAFRARFRRISRTNPLSEIDENAQRYTRTQDFIDNFVTWLYQGCKKYLEIDGKLDDYDGTNLGTCNLPMSMKRAIAEYIGQNDNVADFFGSFYVRAGGNAKVPCQEMMKEYINYTNDKRITMQAFMKLVYAAVKRWGDDLKVERKWCMIEDKDGNLKNHKVLCVTGIRPVRENDELNEKKQSIKVVNSKAVSQ